MWWLAAILAVLCALALGGYKYKSLHQYVENEVYENRQQVAASLFVGLYSDADPSERVNNIRKIASSNRAYQNFKEITGYDLTVQEYQNLFEQKLTLKRLGEAVTNPKDPNLTLNIHADQSAAPSDFVEADIEKLIRMKKMFE